MESELRASIVIVCLGNEQKEELPPDLARGSRWPKLTEEKTSKLKLTD